jgi:hypothetical protein
VVAGGLVAATFVIYPFSEIQEVLRESWGMLYGAKPVKAQGVFEIFKLAQLQQQDIFVPKQAMAEIQSPLLRDSLDLLTMGLRPEDMKKNLETRVSATTARSTSHAAFLLTLSKLSPAFGLVGTLIGLVTILYEMGGGSGLEKVRIGFAARHTVGEGTRGIEDVQQDATAFNMLKECDTKAFSLRSSFDETRNVADDEVTVEDGRHSKVWNERSEVIRRNFRTRSADDGDDRRLSHTWAPNNTHVGDKLKLEFDEVTFTWFAKFGEVWLLTNRRNEVGVSISATAALCDEKLISMRGKFSENFERGIWVIGIGRATHLSSRRNPQANFSTVFSMTV